MLDLFVIFSKSGIVLFATVNGAVNGVVNKLIKNVILEERTDQFVSDNLALQYRLDNEFELVFVVGYQKMLALSYIDKFLDDVCKAFRDKYNDYDLRSYLLSNQGSNQRGNDGKSSVLNNSNIVNFDEDFKKIYNRCIKLQNNAPMQEMRTFQQSAKSKKTVASMIINPEKEKEKEKEVKIVKEVEKSQPKVLNGTTTNGDKVAKKLAVLSKGTTSPKASKKPAKPAKKEKVARQWELSGKNDENLDFSKKTDADNNTISSSAAKNISSATEIIDYDEEVMDVDLELEVEEEDEEETKQDKKSSVFGSFLKTFKYNKALTKEDLDPVLAQLREHLIAKNVAAEIATKLCESVNTKLDGQQVNTWMGLKSFVKASLEESILRILSPNRNINILRDVKAKQASNPPYVIVFCGVNGVGKSTNLAKIANWLIVNGIKVLVIACDTFRAGAIEQLRTHITALKTIHEKDGKSKIDLFEKGYGKDSAGIAFQGTLLAAKRADNIN